MGLVKNQFCLVLQVYKENKFLDSMTGLMRILFRIPKTVTHQIPKMLSVP
jgi:hypothetical protein